MHDAGLTPAATDRAGQHAVGLAEHPAGPAGTPRTDTRSRMFGQADSMLAGAVGRRGR